MKYFRVEEEYIQDYAQRVAVDADGDTIGENYEADPLRRITLGYIVIEEDSHYGKTQDIEFYSVQTDPLTFEDNHVEVLEQIKQDYPADKWENPEW